MVYLKNNKMEEKTLVYTLTLDGVTAVYFTEGCLIDGLKMELDNLSREDLLSSTYEVGTREMTEEEIDNMGEFDGF